MGIVLDLKVSTLEVCCDNGHDRPGLRDRSRASGAPAARGVLP